MIPILYEANETQFLSQGIGRLTDVISCTVTQNSEYEYVLEMEYPIDGIHSEEIKNNRYIYAIPERGKNPQPFRIRNIEKKLDRKIKVTARHICHDLSYYPCSQIGEADVTPYQTTPVLCDPNENVIGELTGAYWSEAKEINNKWQLYLMYPIDGHWKNDLVVGYKIYAQPQLDHEAVMFTITNKQTVPGIIIGIVAEADITEVPFHFNMLTPSGAVSKINQKTFTTQPPCPFTISVEPSTAGDEWAITTKEFFSDRPKSLKSLLWGEEGSLEDVYGGEWEFDKYNCIFHEQRGANNGVQYRYGKNIVEITERINIDEIYTHAFSFWKGTASSSTNTEEGEYFTKIGRTISILQTGFAAMFPQQRTLIIDASDEFEEEPSQDDLDDYTRQYTKDNDFGKPTVTIEVSIVDLAGSKEYEDIASLEQVSLYDTVTVVFPEFGIQEEARITEVKYNVLREKNDSVIIGDVTTSLSNIIARTKKSITSTKYQLQRWADKAMERATEALAGWKGGNIRKNYNKSDHKQQSMYIMNTDDVKTATQAVKFDERGLSVSNDGARGTYTSMVGLNGSSISFSDQFADSGNTNGSFLKRGTISSGNDNEWDLENNTARFHLSALEVTGATAVGDNLLVTGNTTLQGTLKVYGESSFYNTIKGTTTFENINAEQGTFTNALGSDIATFRLLTVRETSTLTGNVTAKANLTVEQTLYVGNAFSQIDVGSTLNTLSGAVSSLNSTVSGLRTDLDNLESRVSALESR